MISQTIYPPAIMAETELRLLPPVPSDQSADGGQHPMNGASRIHSASPSPTIYRQAMIYHQATIYRRTTIYRRATVYLCALA